MRALFRELPIRQPADVSVVRHIAGQMAAEQDFPCQRQAEIRLMASELAQNHLDHATKNGLIRVSSLRIQNIACLTLASLDQGPGIADVPTLLAQKTGCPSATDPGVGLVSIRRLADQFALCSGTSGSHRCPGIMAAEQGTIIVACSWHDSCPPLLFSDHQLDIAGIVCGRSENMPCGDGLLINGDDRFIRIVMVDSPGLGKGCSITREIKNRLQGMNMIWPPDQLFERLSFALNAGASLAILRFDRLQEELQWAGVGNINTWIMVDDKIIPTIRQPLADIHHTRVELFRAPVRQDVRCLLHSDGLEPFKSSEIKSLLNGRRTMESSLVLQTAFSMNRQQQDDAALCVCNWCNQ